MKYKLSTAFICFVSLSTYSQLKECIPFNSFNQYSSVKEISRDFSFLEDNLYLNEKLKNEVLQLIVLRDEIKDLPKYSNLYRKGVSKGYCIYLINNTNDPVVLQGMDGAVLITRQVFHSGKWTSLKSSKKARRPICGNSFFSSRKISPNSYLSFVAPCIEGEVPVKMRFVLNKKSSSSNNLIISNSFDTFVHWSLLN
ncbi:hypothetical protein [Flagellimonas pacifica]|uniref:hypothetical protein n=1 Tax=Flagellimonas pacifica TaxID=1247520 RepID=UPI0010559E14|nr:hypothetical protein [Allomuricauda parva]